MRSTASNSMQAESGSSLAGPISGASRAASIGPAIAPVLPPAAMKPYSRRAWSLRYRSAMKLQNTDTTKRLKTLTQMKKACGANRNPMRNSSRM